MTMEAGRFFDEEGGAEEGRRRESEAIGGSGSVVEGAGFGEGMFRNDSFDVRRRAGVTGVGGVVIIGFSVRLRRGENMVGWVDVGNVRKVMNGFYVSGACPAGGLGEEGELASVGRSMPAVCQVQVEERAELDGVPLSGLERKVDGGSIVSVGGGEWHLLERAARRGRRGVFG